MKHSTVPDWVQDFLDHIRTTCIEERQALKLRARALEEALTGLLDTVERGDEYLVRERCQTAGRLLGLARYDGPVECSEGYDHESGKDDCCIWCDAQLDGQGVRP